MVVNREKSTKVAKSRSSVVGGRGLANDPRPPTVSLYLLLAEQIRSRCVRVLSRGGSRWRSRRLLTMGFSRCLFALLKFLRIEQRASQRSVVARPRAFRSEFTLEVRPHRFHL